MKAVERYDAIVVGAGILGLAHAYLLAKRGLRVAVFERGARATGASIRNFGMVWPIGQPPGELRSTALRSRQIWLEILAASGIWHRQCGSLHLAYHQDELGVLEEFVGLAPAHDYRCELVSPDFVLGRAPVIRSEGLLGGMWSPDELCVFPRQVIAELPEYLSSLGVTFHFSTAVTEIGGGVAVAGGREVHYDHAFLCTGDDFETLFPAEFKACGMIRSKLQMLRARPRRADYKLDTHLCAGLTLGHYANFRVCQKLDAVLNRFNEEYPEHQRWGIHLLVSRHEDGCLTIGDSHEYGDAPTPFLSEEIERLILGYLDTFLPVEHLEVVERWHGVYAKHPSKAMVIESVSPGITAVTGVGGAGMTLSFGVAEKVVEQALGA